MTYWGQLQNLKMDSEKKWLLVWVKKRNRRSVFNACGRKFWKLSSKYYSMCKCLPGFKAHSI